MAAPRPAEWARSGRGSVGADKQELRLWMRRLRRDLPDRTARSQQLWERVVDLTEVHRASTVLLFTTIVGEPDTAPFAAWCEADGKSTLVPEDHPEPVWPDLVIVPGLAFTARGERLGQGGGWYDRFLRDVRSECVTVGVGFTPQVLRSIPVEPHDVVLDIVCTDSAVYRR